MPHIIVKLQAGRPNEVKVELARKLTHTLMATLRSAETSVSVAIEDIAPGDWVDHAF